MFVIAWNSAWSPVAVVAVALGAGLVAGLATFLVLHLLLMRRQAAEEEYEREHSILPEFPEPDPYAGGSFSEQRVTPRRKGNPIAILVADGDTEQEPFVEGFVIDRSTSGLGLELLGRAKFKAGMRLTIRPKKAPDQVPWTRIIVRHFRQLDDHCRLGCKFARHPGSELMMMFG
jgi:hypothetical protein